MKMDPRWIVLLALLGLPACARMEAGTAKRADLSPPSLTVVERRSPKRIEISAIRKDLFTDPAAPNKKPLAVTAAEPPQTPPAPPPPDPLAGWEYVGDVEIDGERMALVERQDTREGRFLRQGDTLNGGRIGSFDKQQIRIALADSERGIARKQDWVFNRPNPNPPNKTQQQASAKLADPSAPIAAVPPADGAKALLNSQKAQAIEALQHKTMQMISPVLKFEGMAPDGGSVVIEKAVFEVPDEIK